MVGLRYRSEQSLNRSGRPAGPVARARRTAAGETMHSSFRLPGFRVLVRHALPHIAEGGVIPLGLFYVGLTTVGLWAALVAALAWSYSALLFRLVTRRHVSGLLWLGAAALTARTAISFATDSTFVYFLQPTLGTAAIAFAFLASVRMGRPLAQRLAMDFLPLPEWLLASPAVRRFFLRVSLLWALVNLASAGITLWLLVSQSIGVFLIGKTVTSWALTGAAVVLSMVSFRRVIGDAKQAAPAT